MRDIYIPTYEYSEKEMKLIKYFGYEKIIQEVAPVTLFRIMAIEAFLNNDQSDYADSVRRCMIAIDSGKLKRLTKEFDDLIYGEGLE